MCIRDRLRADQEQPLNMEPELASRFLERVDACLPEADGAAGGQTEVFFRRVQHEVVPFNPDFPCDGEAADALFRFFRIVQHLSLIHI